MKYFNWSHAGKAIAAGVAALIGALLLVISGNETFADVTVVEWLLVLGTVLGSYGFTYNAPANTIPPGSGKRRAEG